MKIKTSTKISLRFTILTMFILFCFSILIFILFFNTRYYKQKDLLINDGKYPIPFFLQMMYNDEKPFDKDSHNNLGPQHGEKTKYNSGSDSKFDTQFDSNFISGSDNHPDLHTTNNIISIVPNNEIYYYSLDEIQENAIILGTGKNLLSKYFHDDNIEFMYYDEKYYIYRQIGNNTVKAIDISGFLIAQFELGQLLISRDIIFILLTFLASMYYVGNGLKKLKKLANYAENLNIDNLSLPFQINEQDSDKDEIKLIGKALNSALQRINMQVISMRDFISNSSHELKTPLMMMSTEIDIALKKKDYEKHLKNLKDYTKRIAELIDSLSLITRLESNTEIQKSDTNIVQICKEQTLLLLKKYPGANIEIKHEDKNIQKQAHEGLFSIVIKNLVENACKYAGDKSTITIDITNNTLTVSDNGIGIKADDQIHLFERFRQVEKAEQGKHSFGLGLYLVKKIVDLHGWKIEVKSEFGKGSKFIITW